MTQTLTGIATRVINLINYSFSYESLGDYLFSDAVFRSTPSLGLPVKDGRSKKLGAFDISKEKGLSCNPVN